jgi:hypothetical protein
MRLKVSYKLIQLVITQSLRLTAGNVEVMPAQFRPKQIKEKYECELVASISSDLYSLVLEDREGSSVFNTLNHSLVHNEELRSHRLPDFVVMGNHGRKGPKEIMTELGSNADLTLR